MEEALVVLSVCGVLAFLWLLRLTVAVAEQKDAQDQLERTAERRYGMVLEEFGKVYQSLITLTEEVQDLKQVVLAAGEDCHPEDTELGDELHLIEERLDRLEECCGLRGDLHQMEKDPIDFSEGRREERCLTGQCHPTDCERDQCPHRTAEFTVTPFRGVLHQFDGQELEDTVLLQQPVTIDLADERHWEKEPAKQDTQTPTKAPE